MQMSVQSHLQIDFQGPVNIKKGWWIINKQSLEIEIWRHVIFGFNNAEEAAGINAYI